MPIISQGDEEFRPYIDSNEAQGYWGSDIEDDKQEGAYDSIGYSGKNTQ